MFKFVRMLQFGNKMMQYHIIVSPFADMIMQHWQRIIIQYASIQLRVDCITQFRHHHFKTEIRKNLYRNIETFTVDSIYTAEVLSTADTVRTQLLVLYS